MSIYIRGDATPFILTGKADDATGRLVGYWSDDKNKMAHVTDISRIIADGGSAECESIIATLELIAPCAGHKESISCDCGDPDDDGAPYERKRWHAEVRP